MEIDHSHFTRIESGPWRRKKRITRDIQLKQGIALNKAPRSKADDCLSGTDGRTRQRQTTSTFIPNHCNQNQCNIKSCNEIIVVFNDKLTARNGISHPGRFGCVCWCLLDARYERKNQAIKANYQYFPKPLIGMSSIKDLQGNYNTSYDKLTKE